VNEKREALAVFAGLSLVYLALRCPSYGPGDSAQHALSAMVWGVPRAPGYPLYTAIAALFAKLGLSAVAAFSGLAQAGAAALLHLYLRRKGLGLAAVAAAGGLLWLSPLQWYYAMIPEVRALNHLLAGAAAGAALSGSDFLLGAVLGLGLSHHPTFLLIVPAVLLLRPGRLKPAPILGAAALFCALPYALLWVRLALGAAPAYNADGAHGFSGVLGLFLRKGTGGLASVAGGEHGSFSLAAFGRQLGWYGRTLSAGLTPVGLFLAATGIYALRDKRREQLAWLVWSLLPVVVYAALAAGQMRVKDDDYAYAIAARFHLLPMIGMAALAAYGTQFLAGQVRPVIVGTLAFAAFAGALMRPVDLRAHEPTRAYARDILAATKEGDAILLDSDDAISSLMFETIAGGAGARKLVVPAMGWNADAKAAWAEGTLREEYEKGDAYPYGPVIALGKPPKKLAVPAAELFLKTSLGSLSRHHVRENTQEIVLTRAGAALAHWHLTRVQAEKGPTDLQARLGLALEGYW
jgi:hypothetical protein